MFDAIYGGGEIDAARGETAAPARRCYIFCPAGDRDRLFEELDRKTAAPLIPAFRDYVLDALTARGDLRPLEVVSIKERLDAWVLDLLPDDKNVVEILEQSLENGSITIPGGDRDRPDGFESVENITNYLNTLQAITVFLSSYLLPGRCGAAKGRTLPLLFAVPP